MFRLLRAWDAERELSPEDFQYILTPTEAFRLARVFYDLNSDNYRYSHFSCHDLPRRKTGYINSFSAPDQRRRSDYVDEVYDYTEMNLDQGWIIGIDTSEQWDYYRNPFYFDEDCNLRYDCFMDHYHSWFEMEVRKAYEKCLNNHNGRKPTPTIKQHYADAPVQHAQSTKAVNTKNAGRLLAAGGVYNGNIDGFRQTAEQLGGDALAGYDEVLNEKTKGIAIAVASVAAGLGVGRLGAAKEISELEKITQVEKATSALSHTHFLTKSGTLLNADKALIDPRKLMSYVLNPAHPVGGNKAKVFEAALGFTQSNADDLIAKIKIGVVSYPAQLLQKDNFGQRMAVDLPITGENGNTAIVRTGWIYVNDSNIPRLTTVFVK